MKSWRDFSTREIDAAVERQQDRALTRYEAEQDRAQAEACGYCGVLGCRDCAAYDDLINERNRAA